MRFLMLDRITELKSGEMALGIKNPSFEECCLPRLGAVKQTMPRTLILESIGQLASWLIIVTNDFKVRPLIASFDKAEFFADAEAGDQVIIKVHLRSSHDDSALIDGEAKVKDKIITKVHQAICTFAPMEFFDDIDDVKAKYVTLTKKNQDQNSKSDLQNL